MYESLNAIELIYDYNEISGIIELDLNLDSSDITLSIDGKPIDDLSKVPYTLGLDESTSEVKSEWIVTSPDEETVYTLRETATPTVYTQVEVLSPASGLRASIQGTTITINYDYSVKTSTAEIQLKSETTPELLSEIISVPLDRTDLDSSLGLTPSISTIGGSYTEDYSLNINYSPEFFSFSTGKDFNDTHPGPHILAGYLTLHAAETGTGYILVKKTGEAAPDFAALKAQAPEYQVYNLKKGQAQWTALVDLRKDTDYTIYAGVEYGAENHMGSISARTLDGGTDNDWGMVYDVADVNSGRARDIKVFEGQTILFPGVVYHSVDDTEWTMIHPIRRPFIVGYHLNTAELAPAKPEGGKQFGEHFSGSDNEEQNHFQLSGVIKQQDYSGDIQDLFVMQIAHTKAAIQAVLFTVEFQD